MSLDALRRAVAACAWSRPNWLPDLAEITWPALERHREAHTKAADDFAGAKTDKAIEAAIRELAEAVETAVLDLRKRCGMTYSPNSHAGMPASEFSERYAAAKADLESEPDLPPVVGRDAIAEWAKRVGALPEVVALGERREQLREDLEAWQAFASAVLNGPTRLHNARVEPIAANEATAAREELDQVGAAA